MRAVHTCLPSPFRCGGADDYVAACAIDALIECYACSMLSLFADARRLLRAHIAMPPMFSMRFCPIACFFFSLRASRAAYRLPLRHARDAQDATPALFIKGGMP